MMEKPSGCGNVCSAALAMLDGLIKDKAPIAAIAINCTAGLHRSVYTAMVLRHQLRDMPRVDLQLWFPAVAAEKANTQTHKQANKQTNKQTSKQANKQTSKQANKQTNKKRP